MGKRNHAVFMFDAIPTADESMAKHRAERERRSTKPTVVTVVHSPFPLPGNTFTIPPVKLSGATVEPAVGHGGLRRSLRAAGFKV